MDDLVIMGLDTLHPIVRIGGMFFRGTWFHCIGTDIVVPVRNDVELSNKDLLVCQRRLVLEQIRLIPKNQPEKASQKLDAEADMEVEQETQSIQPNRFPDDHAQPENTTNNNGGHDEEMGNVEAAREN
ncbi:transcription factor TFIIIC subunit Sfc7 [Schizosaccharomyces osmophilus]|uniref:Transcription factor TFIIIC subunit Sfc7 n=1 Tax=Schizosaccharomyces osmophilus TaxID=2545709 RepID=A0AAE9WDK4_9SCHI|nr:transcription factor TFIIIC subunit Sfc7 [Schizosaccharomyces osmophilus]WBW73960.1 transcription factor TFIIIC subunit Sfc7 [Schizosaccharomyces osmophilus]